jgi:hypothetical protein
VAASGSGASMSVSMRKATVILRFNPCSRLCSHLGISLCLFEFCKTVVRSVVLLEDFHGSARWDVLPVGREVSQKHGKFTTELKSA